ncbi:hypothetical protein [Cellulomonas xylanilytica]|uniref:hypothetical protein n=1 Tax=Cellulomonas xylanilytica TaxID=233583 RepID=UPI001649BA8F|nr:hypothetical protein [Cellulomonas xylanilytica]
MVALTATVGLVGCSGQPGAAAVVDGTAIPTSDLEAALTELSPWLPDITTTNLLALLVQEPTVVELAEEKGVGVSDEDAQALLDSVVEQRVEGATATFTEPSLAVARYSIAYSNLEALPEADDVGQEIDGRLRELDITVNPRFASLQEGFQIGAPVRPSWLVDADADAADDGAPEPQPTPEPAPSAS